VAADAYQSLLQPNHAILADSDEATARPIEIYDDREHYSNQQREYHGRSMALSAREAIAVGNESHRHKRDGEQQEEHGLRHMIVQRSSSAISMTTRNETIAARNSTPSSILGLALSHLGFISPVSLPPLAQLGWA
jgi:hypothetical protein